MKISIIFAEKLYAIHYPNDKVDVFRKTLKNWQNPEYLFNFLNKQKNDINLEDIPKLIEQIIEDAHKIDVSLVALAKSKTEKISTFFRPLYPSEYQEKTLSQQKARITLDFRKSNTRIYGIKIEANCYIITGGALKFTQKMQDRKHTKKELNNLNNVKHYLQENDIIDADGFYEFYHNQ